MAAPREPHGDAAAGHRPCPRRDPRRSLRRLAAQEARQAHRQRRRRHAGEHQAGRLERLSLLVGAVRLLRSHGLVEQAVVADLRADRAAAGHEGGGRADRRRDPGPVLESVLGAGAGHRSGRRRRRRGRRRLARRVAGPSGAAAASTDAGAACERAGRRGRIRRRGGHRLRRRSGRRGWGAASGRGGSGAASRRRPPRQASLAARRRLDPAGASAAPGPSSSRVGQCRRGSPALGAHRLTARRRGFRGRRQLRGDGSLHSHAARQQPHLHGDGARRSNGWLGLDLHHAGGEALPLAGLDR
jgi:hypothetical protein